MVFKNRNSGVHYLDNLQRGSLKRPFDLSEKWYTKDLFAHYGCVNAVEFSSDGEWLASGGDDKRVLLWNVDKALALSGRPNALKGEHNSNIFCLGFSASRTKLLSAGNDEQVILHDLRTAEVEDVFLHDEAVYCVSADPFNDKVFLSACDDGQVLMWDVRLTTSDPTILASCSSPYHTVMHNPMEPTYVATGGAKDGVCLWDARRPRVPLVSFPSSKGAMSVRFNSSGTQLLALRRRLPPVLYDMVSGACIGEFDHPEYYNSCTMKSCCFAGDREQYVLSGSDDFKLYAWRVPPLAEKTVLVSRAHFKLRGHRSIVNQVRFNGTYGILASSGVEKIVKLWSPLPFPRKDSVHESEDEERKVYTHEEYINLVLESGHFMTHDYSHQSVQEDPRMMAFFDSLVQRDIEGLNSDSLDSTDVFSTSVEVALDSSSSSSEECSQNSDRISQLISKKHRETKLRAVQSNLNSLRNKQDVEKTDQLQATPGHHVDVANPGPSNSKDKRKILIKKRAKLSRNVDYDDSSSDSDLLNENVQSSSTFPCSRQHEDGNLNNELAQFKTENSSEDLQVTHEQPRISADERAKNLSNADSLVAFIAKNKKNGSRNYRKRSAEDRDDDL